MRNIQSVPPEMGGIYAIINVANGRCYIGSSHTIRKRLNYHRRALERDRHPNPILQASWNKHGPEAFICDIFEPV